MKPKMIIAVDPGSAGGFATCLLRNGHCAAFRMPPTPGDVRDFWEMLHTTHGSNVVVYLEKVGGFAGVKHPGSAMFNFGHGVGIVTGLALAYRWEIRQVTPQKWMKSLGLHKNGEKGTVWKNRLKARAQEIYPNVPKITLATSDALLLLDYARKDVVENG